MRNWVILVAGTVLLFGSLAGSPGVDAGIHAAGIPGALDGSAGQLPAGTWIRLREMAPASGESEAEGTGLGFGVKAGLNLAVLQRWTAESWDAGVRLDGTARLPLDLREAFDRSRRLGMAHRGQVRAWEIDNEPDLGFVPESVESYAAFLKAAYLGFQRGFDEARGSGLTSGNLGISKQASLVIMGALGLPPGPWLERFAANDGFAYTDGFNYHYYGYADDFAAVYRQHKRAVAELTAALVKAETGRRIGADGEAKLKAEGSDKSATSGTNPQLSAFSSQLSPASVQKNLPVFLTEVGYGMLGKSVRDTKEGRLRQWRWFKSVGKQAVDLRIEAPMAFVLQPYLEYDTLEFGLTVPASPGAQKAETRKLKAEGWVAGGIEYRPEDFGTKSTEPWMEMIGKQIDGNEVTPALAQWLSTRAGSGELGARSRFWSVSVPAPSPVVIDFINGEGLSFVKRFNGSFVTAKTPITVGKIGEPKPKPQLPNATSESPRREEFMIHVRTRNGNLYEVYPTRMASPDWQTYQEPHDNFTMAFYGRAELPWRFKDNQPASLVVVMYPKQLPAVYEFRRPRLVRLSEPQKPETGNLKPEVFRFGQGKVILYNFSDKPVAGRLQLPEAVGRVAPNAPDFDEVIILQPGERREISISIKVPWGAYERIEAAITFLPEDKIIPPARFVTAFLPDIGGLNQTVVAKLLPQPGAVSTEKGANHKLLLTRPRADEEAPMFAQEHFFAQQGATVERTTDGFNVTVTEMPLGKEKRVEVEIPWPEGLGFAAEDFLSVDFRLGGAR